MRLSEISPSSIKIDRLLNRISEGDIKIPAFQRGFVWTQEQVIKLLDSIYNDYPIGSILLWNSSEKLTSTRNIAGFLLPDREPQYPINYILDGQQRLSAIYAVFSKDREKAPVKLPYSPDPAIFDLYFDLDEENIVAEKDIKEEHKYLKMNTLFDVNAFYEELNKFNKENKKQAQLVLSKFQNYEIPIVTTTKRKKEDVGNIFERINHTGTTLSTLDLMIAWTWSENFHLREEINDIKSKLDDKGFGDTDEKIILQCLGGIIDKTAKTKDILALKPESVRTNIELLKSSLEKTIDFLATEINIASSDFLPHSHQIVPLAFLFSRVNMPSQEQIKVVKQWFWKTSFSNRYAGSTDTKMNEDISFFEKVANNDFSDMVKYSYSIDRNSLIDQVFSKSNPFTRAFLLLLAQKKPLNLINGSRIDLGKALSQYNAREYHHIFPRNFLKSQSKDDNQINCLCNFCFLPSDSNKTISSKPPSEYMGMIPVDQFSKRLRSNLIPTGGELYEKNQYQAFLKRRARLIMNYLDKQIAD